MKKLIAMLLVLAMTLCFTACGGDGGDGGDETPKTPDQVTGETYDAGNVSVLVPKGWKAFPVSDMWSDDANATDPDQVNIVKGGESEFDLFTKPYMLVIHYEPESMMTPSKDFYDDAKDLAPITAGGLTWEGFSAVDFLGGNVIIIWTTNADGHQFQINIINKTDSGEFAMTDADVLAILASVVNS